jgi:glycosyltransferase involved in cell wall biosynthesis
MRSGAADIAIVIPAYRPGATLVALVDSLLARGAGSIIVVDDGSGPAFASSFEGIAQRGRVHILHHAVNLGKGAALKTGLNYALAEVPGLLGVVTADADGQHRWERPKPRPAPLRPRRFPPLSAAGVFRAAFSV